MPPAAPVFSPGKSHRSQLKAAASYHHYSMKAGARPAAGLKYRSIIINTLRREMICEGIMTRENGVYTRADA